MLVAESRKAWNGLSPDCTRIWPALLIALGSMPAVPNSTVKTEESGGWAFAGMLNDTPTATLVRRTRKQINLRWQWWLSRSDLPETGTRSDRVRRRVSPLTKFRVTQLTTESPSARTQSTLSPDNPLVRQGRRGRALHGSGEFLLCKLTSQN